MNKLRFLFLIILAVFLPANLAFSDFLHKDIAKFRQYNPDGQKFEFVQTFLSGLKYLQLNDRRALKLTDPNLNALELRERYGRLTTNIVTDNINLRLARNLVKKFVKSENGLILKAANLFVMTCDEQIEINNREKIMLDELYKVQKSSDAQKFDNRAYLRRQRALGLERKESFKKMLEASLLVKKILISDKPDRFGELIMLGITQKQRVELLSQLKEFQGKDFEGELREGQSFLEGSISAIREILEDKTWATLDG